MRVNSVNNAISDFLRNRGKQGALLREIYPVVNAALGREVPTTSVQSAIYKRLVGAKGSYVPRYERFYVAGKSRYRML
jgi:hypothetical protein